ncbi:hypothetical protein F4820DRAFT_459506 [Hypoxylon rubiginosum]|uniref:Uncharacterized protein n=1 Tax=Hypoxylon rubiginosum TaxID=110542 RepID=A0ACB9YVH0_9PEZI|nr:hypothetical protein F4820DRAFT_459506 [Hypoxylon rubiginosum]
MGSAFKENDRYVLPHATAPSLLLKHPTEEQKRRTWTLNHKEWGGALSLQEYLEREPYVTTIPLSRNGGMTHWILTDAAWTPTGEKQTEPVLASCETIRKPVLVANPDGSGSATVTDDIAHGIGSVFTYPEHRGNRYAGRMMNELSPALKSWQTEEKAACSALWSDIGKEYYAKRGWAAFPSLHVEFSVAANDPASQAQTSTTSSSSQGEAEASGVKTTPISYDNLEALCERDEQLLRKQIVRTAVATKRKCVAFVPDHDTMRWHLYRDDFVTSIVFKSSPLPLPPQQLSTASSAKGALAGAEEGRRVWALWSRSYGGSDGDDPAQTVDKNTLYILRLVVEPEATTGDGGLVGDDGDDEDVVAAFAAVMRAALREARTWHLGKVDLWNPSPAARRLVERCGLQHRWVDRGADSIPSMMWYGSEDVRDIEWVANEKYCWC